MSKSSYHSHFKTKEKKIAKWNKLDQIVKTEYHNHNGILGYRKIYHIIQRNDEIEPEIKALSKTTILKSMRRQKIRSIVQKRPKNGNYKPNNAVEDLVKGVENGFSQKVENLIWYSDFTYVKVNGVHKYICAIIDSYYGELIGCKVSDRIDSELAVETLRAAISRNKPNRQVILHTDQGVQYRSNSFIEFTKLNGIIQSMSRPGTPTDNAMMESFMGKLKTEKINHHEYKKLRDLEKAVEEYKDYYNNKRLKQSIGYKTIKEVKEEMVNL